MIKAVRAIYRKADGEVVWAFTLEGPGEFPVSLEDYLAELPTRGLTGYDNKPIDGVPEDYACITETDLDRIAGFNASDNNRVVDGELVIGEPRPPAPGPIPPLSTHPARIDAINPGAVKPATVTRIFLTEDGFTTLWNDKEWQYDCYVTQSVVDQWQEGKIVPGDFVLIEFLEGDISKPILAKKLYRSWGG